MNLPAPEICQGILALWVLIGAPDWKKKIASDCFNCYKTTGGPRMICQKSFAPPALQPPRICRKTENGFGDFLDNSIQTTNPPVQRRGKNSIPYWIKTA